MLPVLQGFSPWEVPFILGLWSGKTFPDGVSEQSPSMAQWWADGWTVDDLSGHFQP